MATTRQIGSYNYGIAVSSGAISGTLQFEKFGKNPDLDSGVREDLWGVGGTWVQPTAATTYNFTSSSASDITGGVGARTITITGLNGSYNEVTETIATNGTSTTTTANSYFIIHKAVVATAGTSATNVGNITSVANFGGTPVGISIIAEKGASQMCIYQVPVGYTLYIDEFDAGSQTAVACDIEFYVKPFGGVFNLTGDLALGNNGNSSRVKTYETPLKISQKSIIKLTALTDTNNCEVHGSFSGILVAN